MNRKKLLPKLRVRWSIKEADRLEDLEDLLHLEYLEDPEDLLHPEYLEDRFRLVDLEGLLHLFRLVDLECLEDLEDQFHLEDLPIALGFPTRFQSIDISYRGHFRRHYTYRQSQGRSQFLEVLPKSSKPTP